MSSPSESFDELWQRLRAGRGLTNTGDGSAIVENESPGKTGALTVSPSSGSTYTYSGVIRDGKLVIDLDVGDEELDKIVKDLNVSAKKAHTLDRL